jgi:phosphate-selective porin
MIYQDEVGITTSINRARLSAGGPIASDFTWRIQGEFRTGAVGTGKASTSLQDAYVRYKSGDFGVQAGQFKTPFTREFLTSLADVETADRSTVVDSLAPKRDIGVMAECAIGPTTTLMLGFFNGEGQNVTANTDSTLLWVGRATVRPVAYLSLGANVASYGSDSTRYGWTSPWSTWARRSRPSTSASIVTEAWWTTRAGTPSRPTRWSPGSR